METHTTKFVYSNNKIIINNLQYSPPTTVTYP